MKRKIWIWVVLGVAVTAAGFVLLPWRRFFGDPQVLMTWLEQWGRWTPLITIGLHILQVITAPIPGTAIDAVNGLLYGPWLGTLFSMVGLMIGSWLAMGLARKLGRPLVEKYVDAALITRLDGVVEKYGSVFIFLVFLVPFLPDDAVCFMAGLTSIPLLELMVLAFLGRSPGVFMANLIGSQVTSLAPWQWGLMAGGFVMVVVVFWRKHKQLPEILLSWVERLSGIIHRR